MKKFIFILAFLQLSIGFAQRPNGGKRGNGNASSSQQSNTQKFEAAKVAGILEYAPKKVLKKLKLKTNDSISTEVTTRIDSYNSEIQKIKKENKDLFEGLDIVVNQNMEAAQRKGNRALMQETRTMFMEKLQPIRAQVKSKRDQLNASLKVILTEAQNSKWLSYQKSEEESLRPKKPKNDRRNRPDDVTEPKRGRG